MLIVEIGSLRSKGKFTERMITFIQIIVDVDSQGRVEKDQNNRVHSSDVEETALVAGDPWLNE